MTYYFWLGELAEYYHYLYKGGYLTYEGWLGDE